MIFTIHFGGKIPLFLVQHPVASNLLIDLKVPNVTNPWGICPHDVPPLRFWMQIPNVRFHVSNWGDERRSEISHLQTREAPLTV